jgi:hypothetical protein
MRDHRHIQLRDVPATAAHKCACALTIDAIIEAESMVLQLGREGWGEDVCEFEREGGGRGVGV